MEKLGVSHALKDPVTPAFAGLTSIDRFQLNLNRAEAATTEKSIAAGREVFRYRFGASTFKDYVKTCQTSLRAYRYAYLESGLSQLRLGLSSSGPAHRRAVVSGVKLSTLTFPFRPSPHRSLSRSPPQSLSLKPQSLESLSDAQGFLSPWGRTPQECTMMNTRPARGPI